MDRQTFCEQVLSRVRHATERERAAIRQELEGHLEDHAEDLRRIGFPAEEAERRALAAMGDPAEIGRELSREYPLRWLVVSRVALAAVVWLSLLLFARAVLLPGQVSRNLQATLHPQGYMTLAPEQLTVVADTDIRAELHGDVLKVYQTGLQLAGEDTYLASAAVCLYNRNPFAATHRDLLQQMAVAAGEEMDSRWLIRGGDGARYLELNQRPVAYGEELVLVYGGFGDTVVLRIPLPWEELP